MNSRHVIRCEGDADKLIPGIIRARLNTEHSTFTLEVPSPEWVTMVQHWLIEAVDLLDEPLDDETYVDIIFDVRNSAADDMERKLNEMSEDELSDFLSELLEELEEELDDEDNNDE